MPTQLKATRAHGAVRICFAVLGLCAASARPAPGQESDSATVVTTVQRYHAALASRDSVTALTLLARDAVIVESGGVETREEYGARHLHSDIAYAGAVTTVRNVARVTFRGDAAWVISTSTTQGEFRGRQINSRGAELMVLSREDNGWRIRAIHWSSRSRNP